MDEEITEATRALLECANRCVSRPPTLDNYVNYMAALSIVVLFSLLVQWHHRSNHPVLSMELSVVYAIWTLLPGTFDGMNLFTHADFMRTLVFIPTGVTGAVMDTEGAEEECRCQICLTDKANVGQLPCGHHGCKECLVLMGHKIQKACPIC
ncbi:unnamed protein product [Zymoseptoria tritici ST99CH_3D1]|nr:unnamed protein product [Zymoseptoria tritici ST99CH_3D1]